MLTGGAQVKITETPFGVTSAQQINKIVWTMLGTTTKDSIYCVSEAPVSQLRFKCTDCLEKNITDINSVLDFAQDLTQNAGFPVSFICLQHFFSYQRSFFIVQLYFKSDAIL